MIFQRLGRKLAVFAGLLSFTAAGAKAQESSTTKTMAYKSIYDIPIEPMKADGGSSATSLQPYKGNVMLIVNVASKCGFTPQYQGLEALHRKYKDQGLAVLGFPSNDFKQQEPGSEAEIVQFCRSKYDVTFPLFAKVKVTGADKAPLYQYLTEGEHPGKAEVRWNFNKWLVGRDGKIIAHYDSKVKPDDAKFLSDMEKALTSK
ncbi:MAG: glutathione peroxidase [Candidatus Sumerlaeaceae bacterium]